MAIEVVGSERMCSDETTHQARGVGDGRWVVSYLPGRQFSCEQAVAALKLAARAAEIEPLARTLGLTAREAFGLAQTRCPWPASRPLRLPRYRVGLRWN